MADVIDLFTKERKQDRKAEYCAFLGQMDDGRTEIEFEIHALDAPNATRYWFVDLPFELEQKVFPAGHTAQEVRQWALDQIHRHVKCEVTIV
jgi:hypothetical protein